MLEDLVGVQHVQARTALEARRASERKSCVRVRHFVREVSGLSYGDVVPERRIALVLSGGGARGAYEVGVVLGMCEGLASHGIDPKIEIFTA